ncbi:MAG: hypothetical protein QW788_01145 [Candidatus Hadarchaeales archaeon]
MVKKVCVLDTSALIGGFSPGREEAEQVTVPSVLNELKEGISRFRLEAGLAGKKVKILEPSAEKIKEVSKLVEKTGDKLSKTDVELLALALSLWGEGEKVEVVTDDYGIQNVASLLGIPHRGLLMPGIRKVVKWSRMCPACGRRYPARAKYCSVCGSELKRIGEKARV